MQKVIMTCGISGSGKSTWATEFVSTNSNWVRFNRDDMRKSLYPDMSNYYTSSNKNLMEETVTAMADSGFLTALSNGLNIVIDNTHLNKTYVDSIKKLIEKNSKVSVLFSVKIFDVDVETAILRDLTRQFPVGKTVINKQFYQFLKIKGKFAINYNDLIINPVFFDKLEIDTSLPKAVIFDIDGTLAHRGDRGPFDLRKVYQDTCDEHVLDMLRSMSYDSKYSATLIVSGRSDECRGETERWLFDKCGIELGTSFKLFMRKSDDNRSDDIIKREIIEKDIIPYYYPYTWFDDRDRVVKMVRQSGIKCFQVEYGDF
jgi:predicted kinase